MAEDERHPEGAEPPESAQRAGDGNETPVTDATEDELDAAVESEHAAVIETEPGRDADRPAAAGA